MIFFAFFAMFLRDLCGEDLRLSKTPLQRRCSKPRGQKDFNRQGRREMPRRTQGEAAMIFFAFFAMFLRDLCGEDLQLSKLRRNGDAQNREGRKTLTAKYAEKCRGERKEKP